MAPWVRTLAALPEDLRQQNSSTKDTAPSRTQRSVYSGGGVEFDETTADQEGQVT